MSDPNNDEELSDEQINSLIKKFESAKNGLTEAQILIFADLMKYPDKTYEELEIPLLRRNDIRKKVNSYINEQIKTKIKSGKLDKESYTKEKVSTLLEENINLPYRLKEEEINQKSDTKTQVSKSLEYVKKKSEQGIEFIREIFDNFIKSKSELYKTLDLRFESITFNKTAETVKQEGSEIFSKLTQVCNMVKLENKQARDKSKYKELNADVISKDNLISQSEYDSADEKNRLNKITPKALYDFLTESFEEDASCNTSEDDQNKNSLASHWKEYIISRCDAQYVLGLTDKYKYSFNNDDNKYYQDQHIIDEFNEDRLPIDSSENDSSENDSFAKKLKSDPNSKRIQIHGLSGVGKTTLLKYLIIKHFLPEKDTDKLPLFISARRTYSRYLNRNLPNNFISLYKELIEVNSKVKWEEFVEKLEDGKVIFFIDGLNLSYGQNLIDLFEELLQEYPNNDFILTSINKDITSDLYKFQKYRLEALNRDQGKKFLSHLFSNNKSQENDENPILDTILTQVYPETKTDLKHSPLFLSCVYSAYEHSGSQEVISEPLLFYENTLNHLLLWDESRSIDDTDKAYQELSMEQRQRLIGFIAIDMMKQANGQLGYYIDKKDLVTKISGFIANSELQEYFDQKKVFGKYELARVSDIRRYRSECLIDSIEHQDGIIVTRINDEYSFVHSEVQLFFAAQYLSTLDISGWEKYIRIENFDFNAKNYWYTLVKYAIRLRNLKTEKILAYLSKSQSFGRILDTHVNISIFGKQNQDNKEPKKEPKAEAWIFHSNEGNRPSHELIQFDFDGEVESKKHIFSFIENKLISTQRSDFVDFESNLDILEILNVVDNILVLVLGILELLNFRDEHLMILKYLKQLPLKDFNC